MKRSEEYALTYASSPFIFTGVLMSSFVTTSTVGLSVLISILTTTGIVAGWRILSHKNYLKKKGITHAEYKMISKYVKDTEKKLIQIRSYTWKSRSIRSIVQLYQLQKASKKMIEQIKTKPNDYYAASDFFHHHVDTALSLVETISKLDRLKGNQMKRRSTLHEAKQSLSELTDRVTIDYESLFNNDVEDLHFTVKLANRFSSARKQIKEQKKDDQKHIR
ncbi:5-bromo-4-chloroindolyl phosphate hydrolysis family protein [Mangrovibacillus cuniculi]|uniref:5-bromo-4-chloroindolyl phosphate hydrolysis protein n=1 Tax=Mangrovibacillus cuniculi TaxID=2593652 RepID=A0A7S8HFI2_9BACI|nr:5-bromo-4-chloroindolyl phosphate hydrolysis family protein [Mangrovibacillus cuniculi]QPC46551.1 hypothetical protein G8O30_06015 [Mangrovibacillus cuniculi]